MVAALVSQSTYLILLSQQSCSELYYILQSVYVRQFLPHWPPKKWLAKTQYRNLEIWQQ